MAGIEKIVDQIVAQANSSRDEKLNEAKAKKLEIENAARDEAEKIREGIESRSKVEVANYKERIVSTADTLRKKAILAAKQEMISDTIHKAYEKALAMDNKAYFDSVVKMVEEYAEKGKGKIYFSEKDRGRLPIDLSSRIEQAARKKGSELEVARESVDIDGGFVLVYGGVEINCSIKAIFDAKISELQDMVQKNLFA